MAYRGAVGVSAVVLSLREKGEDSEQLAKIREWGEADVKLKKNTSTSAVALSSQSLTTRIAVLRRAPVARLVRVLILSLLLLVGLFNRYRILALLSGGIGA